MENLLESTLSSNPTRVFSTKRVWRSETVRASVSARLLLVVVTLWAALTGCAGYDVLVEKDQVAAEKWANVDANLQRRADLIPNLVAVVKGSAAHEKDTLDAVVKARAEATSMKLSDEDLNDPEKMKAFVEKQDALSKSLGRLLMIQEAYPDLKANQGFRDLQVQLEGTENRILRAREEYNAAARDYNAELGKVRGKVYNKVTGKPFAARAYYVASESAQTVPSVAF